MNNWQTYRHPDSVARTRTVEGYPGRPSEPHWAQMPPHFEHNAPCNCNYCLHVRNCLDGTHGPGTINCRRAGLSIEQHPKRERKYAGSRPDPRDTTPKSKSRKKKPMSNKTYHVVINGRKIRARKRTYKGRQ